MNRLDPSCPTAWSAAIIWLLGKIFFPDFSLTKGNVVVVVPFRVFFDGNRKNYSLDEGWHENSQTLINDKRQTTEEKKKKFSIRFHVGAQHRKRNFLDSLTKRHKANSSIPVTKLERISTPGSHTTPQVQGVLTKTLENGIGVLSRKQKIKR